MNALSSNMLEKEVSLVEKVKIQVYHLKNSIMLQDLYIILCACLIGLVSEPFAIAFRLPLIAYVTMRKKHEVKMVMSVLLIISFFKGLIFFYIDALIFSFYFLCIQIAIMSKYNRMKCLPWICILIAIPYLLYLSPNMKVSFTILIYLGLNLFNINYNIRWVERKLQLHKSIYASILLSILFILIQLNLKIDSIYFVHITIFMIALLCKPIDVLLSVLLISVIHPNIIIIPWVILFLLLSLYQNQKKIQLLLSVLVIFYFDWNYINIASSISIGLICLLYQERFIPYLKCDDVLMKDNEAGLEDLNLKLANFSSIFSSLSTYYESFSNVEADMLSNMSTALVYSSDELKKYSYHDNQREKVLKALEGYRYLVDDLLLNQNHRGEIYIELTIMDIKRSEITSTLIPLLEVILKCRFEIDEIKARRLKKMTHRIVIHSAPVFKIDAYGDSAKNIYEKSGDCFSIFQFRQNVVCMISDGMGNGVKAANSSRLITNIFQRMIACGIAQDSCIRCINKLLQSDAYATLDVVSFDQSSGYAYISKSAACPTFLIRDNEVFEVNGSALPIGIVNTMEPDCFKVKLKAKDAYLMVSDGIHLDEIYEWIKTRDKTNAREQIESMMNILSKQDRFDDSTVLLAIVDKIKS